MIIAAVEGRLTGPKPLLLLLLANPTTPLTVGNPFPGCKLRRESPGELGALPTDWRLFVMRSPRLSGSAIFLSLQVDDVEDDMRDGYLRVGSLPEKLDRCCCCL